MIESGGKTPPTYDYPGQAQSGSKTLPKPKPTPTGRNSKASTNGRQLNPRGVTKSK